MLKQTETQNDYYQQLVGGRITAFEMVKSQTDGQPYPAYSVTDRQGRKLQLELTDDADGKGMFLIYDLAGTGRDT